MKLKIFFLMFLIALVPAAVFAETTIKAQVEKAKITTDEAATYKVIVASSETMLPIPQFPEFKGFTVISRANSSTVSFQGGAVKTILVYAFILAPNATGKLKIDPASIKVKNEVFTSQAAEIEVTQGKRVPSAAPQNPRAPQKISPGPQEPQYSL